MRSRSEVEAKKVPNENGTSLAVSCQLPPALPRPAGIVTARLAESVREEKLTSSWAPVSVPALLSWLVGDVLTTGV